MARRVILFCMASCLAQLGALAQGAASVPLDSSVKFTAFLDVYYAYDFGHSSDDDRQAFLYQYDRHSEVDLNLGLVQVEYERTAVRAALGLMAGTYAQANMINEPELLRNVQEARVGLRLNTKGSLWLDAGVFTSHIGSESAIGIDNWTLTRSVLAENSPYYLSGAKLTWKASDRLEITALFMNGWQRIRRIQNRTPCLGSQVLWKVNDEMKLNWSTFAGSDVPDSLGYYRIYNDLWWSLERPTWGLQLCVDAGIQQNDGAQWEPWGGAIATVRRKLSDRWTGVVRAETYSDPEQVILYTGTPHGYSLVGYSIGCDLQVAPDSFLRFEARTFHGADAIFADVHGSTQDNTAITVSAAVRFR